MQATEVQDVIVREITELLLEEGKPSRVLSDSDTLLTSDGLDSLGFAVLVTRLEDALGYDPFTEMAEPVYPVTLGEFVDVYVRNLPAS